MFQILRDFNVGRPQVLAGFMLLAFMGQCFWAAKTRKISELEYQYMFSGAAGATEAKLAVSSPLTSLVARVPVQGLKVFRKFAPASWSSALAIPPAWWLRLPFVIFGVWLGGALWWVARRLFDDAGGYLALGLYCTSPAMIKISSNIGPEIILAWSLLGLVYTAIGVAHTLFAPPRKWAPRIVILGLSIGFALATSWLSFAIVLLGAAYMVYLAPGCRRKVAIVLSSATALGCLVFFVLARIAGSAGPGLHAMFAQKPGLSALRNLAFPLSAETDGYVLVFLFIAALTAYGSWPRARYFGNTAPLVTGLASVLIFALAPSLRLWDATLGLTFVFIFVGGLFADLLETKVQRTITIILLAGFAVRVVLTFVALRGWVQNLM